MATYRGFFQPASSQALVADSTALRPSRNFSTGQVASSHARSLYASAEPGDSRITSSRLNNAFS